MHLLATCLIALAFGFFGSMPLAGPIAVMVFSRASHRRYAEALHIGLGAAVAEGIYAGVAFWSFTSLLATHPLVVPVSRGVTAVVLSALGVRFALWSAKPPRDTHESAAGTALVGFSLSAINLTLLVTWSAAVAFLYAKGLGERSSLAALPFGACAAAGIAGWFAILVAILRRFEGKLPVPVLTWTIRTLGLALLALGLWSGVQLAQWLAGDRGTPPERAVSLCSPPCSPRARCSTPTWPSRPPNTSCSGTGSRGPRDGCSPSCSTCCSATGSSAPSPSC
jgi:threonine/homoserine/homoserine lactone efflux protein